MIYKTNMLVGILLLQLLLVAGVVYVDVADTGGQQGERWLSFVADDVNRIVISSADERVELSNLPDGWVVGEQIPAGEEKIAGVLEKLAELKLGWPVATSANIQDRFEVSDETYQRRVQLFAGEAALADLYLGSSPGYRRVHARSADSEDIFSMDFSTFEVPTDANDWLDKALLGASGSVTQVTRAGLWTLTQSDEGWLLEGQPAQGAGAANQEAADALAERLRNLRVMALAEGGEDAAPDMRFTVTDSKGDHELGFWHDAEADEYVVTSSRASQRFTVASYIAEQILVDADALAAGDGAVASDAADGAQGDA